MIPETPAFYKLAVAQINSLREKANKNKAEIDALCEKSVTAYSDIIWAHRDSCKHDGIILLKESVSGRPHEPDIYVCSLCTGSLQHPLTSAEIVRVSQEELMKFYCK